MILHHYAMGFSKICSLISLKFACSDSENERNVRGRLFARVTCVPGPGTDGTALVWPYAPALSGLWTGENIALLARNVRLQKLDSSFLCG